jgi:hypothetical protein
MVLGIVMVVVVLDEDFSDFDGGASMTGTTRSRMKGRFWPKQRTGLRSWTVQEARPRRQVRAERERAIICGYDF